MPGVPGIGVKTAAELIQHFGDLDTLLAQAETIKQPKRRENLINFAEQARISRQLVTLRDDAPTPLDLSALVTPPRDMARLTTFLQDQGFNRLLVRIGVDDKVSTGASKVQKDAKMGGAVRSMAASPLPADKRDTPLVAAHLIDVVLTEDIDYQLITDRDALAQFLAAAVAQGFLCVDTETTGLNAAGADLVGVAMALAPGKACYVPLRHGTVTNDVVDGQSGLDFSASFACFLSANSVYVGNGYVAAGV